MTNLERVATANGCLISELQTMKYLSPVQKKIAKISKTALALYMMLMLFFAVLLFQPLNSFGQVHHAVVKKAQAKKTKHKNLFP
jgi:hypothetical protein